MDSVLENENVVHGKVHKDITDTEENGADGHIPKKEGSSSSSVSSDEDSLDEDFFQLDASQLSKPPAAGISPTPASPSGLPPIEENAELILDASPHFGLSSTPGGVPNHPGEDLILSGAQPMPSMSSSDFADSSGTLGTRQSPLSQVMVSSDVPDPNRIPSAIFSRTKSTAPMEWSVASNESLFSIHMGNSSFSRDHMFLMGRSGELGSPTDPYVPNSLSPLSPSSLDEHLGSPMPPDAAEAAAEANAHAMQEVLRASATEVAAAAPKQGTGNPIVLSASISKGSDGSHSSFRSFAFPILTGDGKNGSLKVEPRVEKPPPQQQQPFSSKAESPRSPTPQTPKEAPKAAAWSKWFPCISCCSFCC